MKGELRRKLHFPTKWPWWKHAFLESIQFSHLENPSPQAATSYELVSPCSLPPTSQSECFRNHPGFKVKAIQKCLWHSFGENESIVDLSLPGVAPKVLYILNCFGICLTTYGPFGLTRRRRSRIEQSKIGPKLAYFQPTLLYSPFSPPSPPSLNLNGP